MLQVEMHYYVHMCEYCIFRDLNGACQAPQLWQPDVITNY